MSAHSHPTVINNVNDKKKTLDNWQGKHPSNTKTTSVDYCRTTHLIDGPPYDAITTMQEATNIMIMYLFLSTLPSTQIASILYVDRQMPLLKLYVISGFLWGVNEVFTLLGSVTSQKSEDLIAVISHIFSAMWLRSLFFSNIMMPYHMRGFRLFEVRVSEVLSSSKV